MYKILDNKSVISRNGYFTKQDLKLIWFENSYANMHDELIELMKKFELCYEIENRGECIAAQLLPREKPKYFWNNDNNLLIKYEYEFMPEGVLTRFIVRIHHLIEDQKLVWREGIIISRENTRAEIIETYGKSDIVIRLEGQHKRELLAIIFDTIDRINDSYEKIAVKKMIPCNCPSCKKSLFPHLFDYSVTKTMLNKNILNQICYKSYESVNNRLLIDDVFGIESSAMSSTKIFLSYAPEDEIWVDQLLKHAKPLEKSRNIFIYTNKKIISSQGYRTNTLELINGADIFLAALSSDYYTNEECMNYEMHIALGKADNSEIMLIPLIIRDSIIEDIPTEIYKPILFKNKPLSEAVDKDQACVDMIQQLMLSIRNLKSDNLITD